MDKVVVFQGSTKTGKEIVIRYPEINDLSEMLRYINELSSERTFVTFQGEKITKEDEKRYLEKKIKAIENKKAVSLLAFNKNSLIGITEISMKGRTSSHVGLLGISVAKEFRRDGIGNLLMDLILKEGEKEMPQLKTIILGVYSTNDIAQNMYKKFGFVEYGRLPEGIFRNKKFEDEILMYKKIR